MRTEALWGRFSGQKLLWEGSFEGRSTLGRLLLGQKLFGKLLPKSEAPWGGFKENHFGWASFGDKSTVGKASAVGKNTFGGSFVRG